MCVWCPRYAPTVAWNSCIRLHGPDDILIDETIRGHELLSEQFREGFWTTSKFFSSVMIFCSFVSQCYENRPAALHFRRTRLCDEVTPDVATHSEQTP